MQHVTSCCATWWSTVLLHSLAVQYSTRVDHQVTALYTHLHCFQNNTLYCIARHNKLYPVRYCRSLPLTNYTYLTLRENITMIKFACVNAEHVSKQTQVQVFGPYVCSKVQQELVSFFSQQTHICPLASGQNTAYFITDFGLRCHLRVVPVSKTCCYQFHDTLPTFSYYKRIY